MLTTMPKTSVIVISGPSASGKTTVGKKLGEEFCWPFFYKDAVKERLFDCLGWEDRARSLELGAASYSILYYFLECQLRAGQPCIVESNFEPDKDAAKFRRLQQKYGCNYIAVFCTASQEILLERFNNRIKTGERHPGHVDDKNLEMIKKENGDENRHFINLGDKVIKIDTTDFDKLDYQNIINRVKSKIR